MGSSLWDYNIYIYHILLYIYIYIWLYITIYIYISYYIYNSSYRYHICVHTNILYISKCGLDMLCLDIFYGIWYKIWGKKDMWHPKIPREPMKLLLWGWDYHMSWRASRRFRQDQHRCSWCTLRFEHKDVGLSENFRGSPSIQWFIISQLKLP